MTPTQIAHLGFLVAEMNESEVRVLVYIAERLHGGRQTYGPLDPNDGRDWRREMLQEMADLVVYDGIARLQTAEAEVRGLTRHSWDMEKARVSAGLEDGAE